MRIEPDHLVVAAATLEQGIDHVQRCLGADCTAGGTHPTMGTHNALLGLGPGHYLEVIAIDPAADAATLAGPRWFGLDDPAIRAALRRRPRLLTWVARTSDLEAARTACRHAVGRPRPMQRGDLHWRIAVPDDGALVEQGLVPPLIEWGEGIAHPAERLPDRGLRLRALHGRHPHPDRVATALAAMGLGDSLELEPANPDSAPRLQAEIETSRGLRWLE